MSQIDQLFEILIEHESKFERSFSLIPSENIPSPLSRTGFMSDGFSRYFFDEKEVFGRWSFEGGSIVGRIQQEILVAGFREIGKARHVNVHPVSGLTGMTVCLAAFGGDAGNCVYSIPVVQGGHPDTTYVGVKLGYQMKEIPFQEWDTLDLDALGRGVAEDKPSLIYIDHATALFPLDLVALIERVRSASSGPVHIHVDTSHVNGLIWGGLYPNPLDCGADSYGGSTHKTFPGPHKGVLFTNELELFEKLTLTCVNMISHHHMGSVIALAIAMLEFIECGGATYAAQTLENARAFAEALDAKGVSVEGKSRGFTGSHQVWFTPLANSDVYQTASQLFEAGLIVNPYNPLPSIGGPGIRVGLNEPTRLGLTGPDMKILAGLVTAVLKGERSTTEIAAEVADFRAGFSPKFCFESDEIRKHWSRLARCFGDGRALFSDACGAGVA